MTQQSKYPPFEDGVDFVSTISSLSPTNVKIFEALANPERIRSSPLDRKLTCKVAIPKKRNTKTFHHETNAKPRIELIQPTSNKDNKETQTNVMLDNRHITDSSQITATHYPNNMLNVNDSTFIKQSQHIIEQENSDIESDLTNNQQPIINDAALQYTDNNITPRNASLSPTEMQKQTIQMNTYNFQHPYENLTNRENGIVKQYPSENGTTIPVYNTANGTAFYNNNNTSFIVSPKTSLFDAQVNSGLQQLRQQSLSSNINRSIRDTTQSGLQNTNSANIFNIDSQQRYTSPYQNTTNNYTQSPRNFVTSYSPIYSQSSGHNAEQQTHFNQQQDKPVNNESQRDYSYPGTANLGYDINSTAIPVPSLSPEELENRKKDEIRRKLVLIAELKNKQDRGVKLMKPAEQWTVDDSLADLQCENEIHDIEEESRGTIDGWKDSIKTGSYALALVNSKVFNNLLKINGWSAKVEQSVDQRKYDSALQRLYNKVHRRGPPNPVFEIGTSLVTSLANTHMKNQFSSILGGGSNNSNNTGVGNNATTTTDTTNQNTRTPADNHTQSSSQGITKEGVFEQQHRQDDGNGNVVCTDDQCIMVPPPFNQNYYMQDNNNSSFDDYYTNENDNHENLQEQESPVLNQRNSMMRYD